MKERFSRVGNLIGKLLSFVRWLFAPEPLPAPPEGERGTPDVGGGFSSWLFESDAMVTDQGGRGAPVCPDRFWRWLLAADRLAESDATHLRSDAPSFFQWALQPEACPELPAANPIEGRGILRRVLRTEKCPVMRPVSSEDRTGFVRRLVMPDRCPLLDVPSHRTRAGFLRWLFAREVCPTEEVSASGVRPGLLRWVLSGQDI